MEPLSIAGSFILFAVPSIILAIILYITIPVAYNAGIPLWISVTTQFLIFMGGLAAAAWYGASRDRKPEQRIAERLRLTCPSKRNVIFGFALGIFMLGSFSMLEFTRPWIRSIIPWGPPSWFAEFMTETHFQGIAFSRKWFPVLVYFVQYFFNVFGEELWWRGYILPRQEKSMGSRAWLANGLLWNLFHWFFFWNLIPLLPSCFALPWTTQRTKSTWTAIIGHGILNGAGLVRLMVLVTHS